MRSAAAILLSGILLLCLAACGHSTTMATTLTGSVTDPAGDAALADLVSATLDVSSDQLTATISFAPGMLSKADMFTGINLDTDENPATGFPGVTGGNADAALIGVDYQINIVAPRGSTTAAIVQVTGGDTFTQVGTAAVTFPTADQAKVTVPLSLLGNDDGHMKFKLVSAQYVTDQSFTAFLDVMPNLGLAPGTVK